LKKAPGHIVPAPFSFIGNNRRRDGAERPNAAISATVEQMNRHRCKNGRQIGGRSKSSCEKERQP